MIREPYVLAIDPPQGAGTWAASGPRWWCMSTGVSSKAKAHALADKLEEHLAPFRPEAVWIEETFDRDTGKTSSVRANSWSAGIIERTIIKLWPDVPVHTGPASEWRMSLGINVYDSKKAKRLAMRLSDKAHRELKLPLIRGPKGGDASHTQEAECMAMAQWKRLVRSDEYLELGVMKGWLEGERFGWDSK